MGEYKQTLLIYLVQGMPEPAWFFVSITGCDILLILKWQRPEICVSNFINFHRLCCCDNILKLFTFSVACMLVEFIIVQWQHFFFIACI